MSEEHLLVQLHQLLPANRHIGGYMSKLAQRLAQLLSVELRINEKSQRTGTSCQTVTPLCLSTSLYLLSSPFIFVCLPFAPTWPGEPNLEALILTADYMPYSRNARHSALCRSRASTRGGIHHA